MDNLQLPTQQLGNELIPGSQLFMAIPQAAPAAAVEAQPNNNELKMILAAFQRCWLSAILAGLTLGTIAAVAVWFLVPKTYTSIVELAVNPNQQVLYDLRATGETPIDINVFKESLKREAKYPYVLAGTLNDKEVKNCPTIRSIRESGADPERWLQDNIQISSPATEFLQITLSGRDAADVHKIVTAYTEQFMKLVVEPKRSSELESFEKQVEILRVAREDLERSLNALTEMDKKLSGTADHADIMFERASNRMLQYDQAIIKLEMNILEARTRLQMLESAPPPVEESVSTEPTPPNAPPTVPDSALPPIGDDFVEQQLRQDPEFQRLLRAVELLDKDVAVYSRLVKADHPNLISKREKLAVAQTELEAYRVSQFPLVRDKIKEDLRLRLQQSLDQMTLTGDDGIQPAVAVKPTTTAEMKELLRTQIREMEITKDGYKAEIDGEIARERESIRDLVERERKAQEVIQLQDRVRIISDRVEARRVEISEAPQAVTLKRESTEARSPDVDSRIKLSGLAGAGLAGLAIALIVLREHIHRRVSSATELNSNVGLSVIGTVPVIAKSVSSRSRRSGDNRAEFWHNALAESFDATRTLLLRNADLNSVRVIMVASAGSGEGKTTLCCHLGTSLARSGRRTLIIDGDVRRPSVHKVFNIKNHPGLCEVLRGEIKLEAALQEVLPSLFILPAGRVSQDVLNALSQSSIRDLLQTVRGQFEFVIVDSSPILPVTDGLLISQHCDGVLFSVRRDISQVHSLSAAVKRFRMLGVKVLGAVAIGLDSQGAFGPKYPYFYYAANQAYTTAGREN